MKPLNALLTDLVVLLAVTGVVIGFSVLHKASARAWRRLVGTRALERMGVLDDIDNFYIDPKTDAWLRVAACSVAEVGAAPLIGRLIWLLVPQLFAALVFVAVLIYVARTEFTPLIEREGRGL